MYDKLGLKQEDEKETKAREDASLLVQASPALITYT
jgi:hypothetical protein